MIEGIFKTQSLENVPARQAEQRNHKDKYKQRTDDTINADDAEKDRNDEVQKAVERIVNAAKYFKREIRLEVENDLGIMIVKVIDSETDKVIRQIPPEELIEISKRSKDLKGLMVDKEG